MSCSEGLADIEDCAGEKIVPSVNTHVLPKALRKSKPHPPVVADSIIPGAQVIYLKTWGCSHNNSDGEYMAGQLVAYGYRITESPLDADLWLLNSCTVKGPSEDSFINAVRSGKKLNKKLVLAGCVPQGQRNHGDLNGLSVVGVQQLDRVVEVVEETLKGNCVRLLGQKRRGGNGVSLSLPKIRRNKLIEIIPINSGCLNQCTYCKTKHARGDLASYPPEEIVARAKQVFQEGVKELWLTSEDTGTYGRDIGTSLPELLWQLVDVIPDGCMMRVGMTNPPYILEHLKEMAAILSHPRVYSFLHVPVQSGSDAVLADMKREYSVDDFCAVADYLRKHVPGINIATDIICGFPTETEEDFEQTLQLVERYKFPSLFINQFYPRPGTPAARMRRIPTQEVKRRSRKLTKLFHSYYPYQHKVGKQQTVLVTEIASDGEHYVGHNKFYDQVLISKSWGEHLMGAMVTVTATFADKHYIKGTPCDHLKAPNNFLKYSLALVMLIVSLLTWTLICTSENVMNS